MGGTIANFQTNIQQKPKSKTGPNQQKHELKSANQSRRRKQTREIKHLLFFLTVTLTMQTLLPPATCAGRFTAVPLSVSAISVPRLPRRLHQPNSLPSLPLKLTSSSPFSTSFVSHRPWKLPFTVTASSQASPTSTPSNEESEKVKLDQVHRGPFFYSPSL